MYSLRFLKRIGLAVVCTLSVLTCGKAAADGQQREVPNSDGFVAVGVAKVDITPSYPVLMNGYLHRPEESQGVLQRIYAKALAMGTDAEGPALLISLDNCGLPGHIRAALLDRLTHRARIIECIWESYRLKQSLKSGKKTGQKTDA